MFTGVFPRLATTTYNCFSPANWLVHGSLTVCAVVTVYFRYSYSYWCLFLGIQELETFRFENEIWLQDFFAYSQKIYTPESFFTRIVNTVIFIKGGQVLPRSQNDSKLNICFRRYEIFPKTCSRLTTTNAFARQNEVGSRASNTSHRKKSRSHDRPRLRI